MEYLKIGNIEIRKESLEGISLTDAKQIHAGIDPRIVKRAWEIANPKRRSKKKSEGK